MLRIDCLVLGYREVRVPDGQLAEAVSFIAKSGVSSTVTPKGVIIIPKREYSKFLSLADGKIEFIASAPCGVYGAALSTLKNYGAIIALFLGLLLNFFLSSIVWDVRVDGEEELTYREIVDGLSSVGFSVGSFWSGADLGEIETAFLKNNPEVAFVNINRRGSVAYVKIAEKEGKTEVKTPYLYSNIVASADGVIEEITVKSGVATVKVGDVVKKGDVLISGILPEDKGGGLCRAEGSVVASLGSTVSVSVPRYEETETSYKSRFLGYRVQIFNFKINILKKYGNSEDGCDIIEDVRGFSFGEEQRLPLKVTKVYEIEREKSRREYTDYELTAIAGRRMNSRILTLVSEGDLIKLKSDGKFTDTGYTMNTYIVYSVDIGEEIAIDAVRER